jgi:hypothetical protein
MPYKNPEDRKEQQRRYRQANKERLREYQRQYHLRNYDPDKAQQYREDNQERIKQYKKEYQQRNKEQIAKDRRQWYLNNQEQVKAKSKQYYQENKEYISQREKQYKQRNKQKINQYYHDRYHSDLQYKLSSLLRRRLEKVINGKQKTGSAVHDLGCTLSELIPYIEQQFTEGMSWDNWSIDGWHLDHIKPLSLFDLTDPEQYKQAAHYTNLQPLWAHDNLSKGNRYSSQ